jgi:short-subunit dehydrogenase
MTTALVTGASSGLGRGLALALAHKGVKVYAAARRESELAALAKEAPGIQPLVLDVGDSDATHAAVAKLDARDPLDLVIANAGIGGPTSATHLEWTEVKRILEVNLLGSAATITGALPGMVARNSGHIVGVSSIAAWRGLPKSSAYSASKAGLSIFLESLRVDLHNSDVAITTICPGFVRTPMNANPKQPTPFIIETEEAVRIMMNAIERRDAECAFPLPLVAAARWLPFLPQKAYDFLASKTSRRS